MNMNEIATLFLRRELAMTLRDKHISYIRIKILKFVVQRSNRYKLEHLFKKAAMEIMVVYGSRYYRGRIVMVLVYARE
jgi:hypothetical protein